MSISHSLKYFLNILTLLPGWHWVIMGALSFILMVFLWVQKKGTVYSIASLGLAVFCGLFLLDAAVVIRYCGIVPHGTGVAIKSGFHRLFHGSAYSHAELISNIAAFVPFGFFLFEFLASKKQLGAWRRLALATLSGLTLSLCLESLQLVLRVGFFELTDLLMNTLGAALGAGLALVGRRVVGWKSNCNG